MLWDKENSISGTHNWVDKSLLNDTKDSFIDKGGGGTERQNPVVDKLDGVAISSAELNSLVERTGCVPVWGQHPLLRAAGTWLKKKRVRARDRARRQGTGREERRRRRTRQLKEMDKKLYLQK